MEMIRSHKNIVTFTVGPESTVDGVSSLAFGSS